MGLGSRVPAGGALAIATPLLVAPSARLLIVHPDSYGSSTIQGDRSSDAMRALWTTQPAASCRRYRDEFLFLGKTP